jgi:hypothetical protein
MNDFSHIEIVSDEMVDMLRTKTPLERLLMGDRMFIQARQMMVAAIRGSHPEWHDMQIRDHIVKRLHGVELRR